jgi:hypothetical protein
LVPTSTLSFVIFLAIVAPGICYELLQQRRHFPRQESAFVEVGRILFSGTLISALTLLLLGLVKLWSPRSMVDAPALVLQGVPYFGHHIALVGWTAVLELLTSTLLAVVFSDVRTGKAARPIQPIDPWHALAERYVKPGIKVNVRVRLKSGLEIAGRYAAATTEPDLAKRELVLSEPIYMHENGDAEAPRKLDQWQALVVPGGEVMYFAVQHYGTPEAESSVRWRAMAWLVTNFLTWKVALPALIVLLVLTGVLG